MNSANDIIAFRKVVVVFDASPPGYALLDLAVELAQCFKTALSGLFIEQEGVLDFAGQPNAIEITLASADLSPVTRERMLAHCFAQARLAKRIFESHAARQRLTSSFFSYRGRPESGLPQVAAEQDLILLSPRVGFTINPGAAALLDYLRQSMSSGLIAMARPDNALRIGPIAAVLGRNRTKAAKLVSTARMLSARHGLKAELFCQSTFGGEEKPFSPQDDEGKPLPLHLLPSRSSLLERITSLRPSLVIFADDVSEETYSALAEAGCSLLLFRTPKD